MDIYLVWGGVIWVTFDFLLISLKQNGLRAGAASMDCIIPLSTEMSGVVPSAFSSWM